MRRPCVSATDARKRYTVVDWQRQRASSYGTFGNVVVNLRGREEHGIVEPGAEYERVREEIAELALDLRGPGAEPIVAAVHKREDLFEGPELEKVPDLLIEFTDYEWLGKGNLRKVTQGWWDEIELEAGSEHRYVGSHRHEGISCSRSARPSMRAARRSGSRTSRRPRCISSASRFRPTSRVGWSSRRSLRRCSTADPPCTTTRPDRTVREHGLPTRRRTRRGEERLRGLGYVE